MDRTSDRSSGGSSHEEPRPKKAHRARKAPAFIKTRPTQWDPTQQRARPADQDYLADEKAACTSLTGLPVVWRKLRIDVQLAMRSGLTYPASTKLLKSGNVSHTLFMAHDLVDMQARVMFWNRLDESDWARFVPEVYNLRAENALDQYERDHQHPELWPVLVDPTQGDGDIQLLGSDDDEEVANEKRDATSTPSKETQAKIAQIERREAEMQEGGQDEEVQDGDVEEAPSTPTRWSKRKLDSASSQSDSSPSPPRSKKKEKARPGETRRQSPLAHKTMSELTPEEIATIEVPGPGINSWRHKDEQAERKRLCDTAAIEWVAKLKEQKETCAPDTMKYEPGIWVYPAKVCNWILNDKPEVKSDGKPYSMAEQLKILDRFGPARIQ
ncbi:uncharacterized protein IUM83_11779 [Phytophthora cinnamomi]|uniref:uncharacterized protein n=1 Tax=Phytophthora cinnamomi TaxID=4785 RepID=UPI003559D6D0|nr:hypothetical protein IUM83_11779 [Phytophthora cinnamomi]